MTERNSILKNTGFLMAGNVLQRCISLFTAILITRYLGPEKYGQYTFVIACVSIVEVFWFFGLDTIIVRDVARDRNLSGEYPGNAIILRSFLFVIITTIMLGVLYLLDYDLCIIRSLIVFAGSSFMLSLMSVFESVFSAWKRMDYSSLLNILRPFIILLLLVLIIHTSGGVLQIFFCYFISSLAVLLAAIIISRRKFVLPPFTGFSLARIQRLMARALPFALSSATSIILFKIDHVMLSKMTGFHELGFYGSAYTLFEVIIAFFPMILIKASFPVLSEKHNADSQELKELYSILFKYFLFLGIPISCGTFLLGDELIGVLFGNEYSGAEILLSLLGGGIWIFFLTILMGWTLAAIDRQMYLVLFGFTAMIINIALNVAMIPFLGAKGAAIATMCSELFVLTCMAIVIKKHLAVIVPAGSARIVLCSIIMTLVIVLSKHFIALHNAIPTLLVTVLIAVLAYLIPAVALNIINKNDLKHLIHAG